MAFLKLYEDFLQKKEVKRRKSSVGSLQDEHDEEEVQPTGADSSAGSNNKKMEHSYTRDSTRPSSESTTGLAPARTILVRRPPQCPSCHTHPLEEHDMEDGNQATVPSYNEITAKESMNECARIAKYVKNNNADDDDWESRVSHIGWSNMQKSLFEKVVRILDNDQLGRLANAGRQNESMQRRVVVDKSAARMRKILASVAWDARLTQWLHCLLMDCLPSTYMASYLDILQTLKSKLPTLMDKMLFGRPLNVSQELLAPVMKKQWEPLISTKSRGLSKNAVIVALPAMPTAGPVPNRLQKWYQHLASITQIVQVTLPMTSAQARQPLDQIAEQIVSLTRVKIQDLRSENSSRSIILIGFNAGAALALQVAMSENIACVICMGFAFNTLNGVRGTPHDRILDIKVPILFVIGQNSARSSTEEIESLREKMQSETALVVVGSGDDMLRVPKSRRKAENVTQSMVDTMVVDEVYEYIQKILENPPGPRIPTSITSMSYKQKSNAGEGPSGKNTPLQRKRKQDVSLVDADHTPAKTKHVQQNVGRPRSRPNAGITTTPNASKVTQIITSTPLMAGKSSLSKTQISPNSITNEDLNLAIQSILSDDPSTILTTQDSPEKMVTNFELVAQSKSTPLKTSLINPLQKHTVIGSNSGTAIGTKIKMIPSNHFVQLKPSLQSQSKIYTIKTTSMLNQPQAASGTSIGSIVSTSSAVPHKMTSTGGGQQQIFTLKTPSGQTTQYVSAQQKYTVVKNAAGGNTLQFATPSTSALSKPSSNLDISNIIDMPIIFADGDGNISDTVAKETVAKTPMGTSIRPSTSSGVGQLIISQKIIKEATNSPKAGTYVINKQPSSSSTGTTIIQPSQQANKPNKVVFINRNTMKPCPNIISRSNVAQQLQKYTKVMVTNPKTSSTTLVTRPQTTIHNSGSPIVTSVKQLNLQALKSPANRPAILNVSAKPLQQFQIINATSSAATNSTLTTSSSGGVATGDKPQQIRNIVVKQIPSHLKTQLINRNLTVRKLVNIVPTNKAGGGVVMSSPSATIGSGVTIQASTTTGMQVMPSSSSVAATASSGGLQSSPKIITLNPINPSTQPKSD